MVKANFYICFAPVFGWRRGYDMVIFSHEVHVMA